jgi:hypothetical protein
VPRIAAAPAHPNLGSPGAGAAGHDRRPGAAPRPPEPVGVAGLAALAAPEQRTPGRRPLPVAVDTHRPRPVRSGYRRPDARPPSRNVCRTRTRPLPQPSGPRGRTGRRCGGRPPRACGEPCGRPARRSHGRPSKAARSARLHRSTAARSAPGRWTPASNPARTRDAPSRHLRSLNSRTLDGMNGHAHDFKCGKPVSLAGASHAPAGRQRQHPHVHDRPDRRPGRGRLPRLAPRSSGSPPPLALGVVLYLAVARGRLPLLPAERVAGDQATEPTRAGPDTVG